MPTDIKKCPFEHPIAAGCKVEDINNGAAVRCDDCGAIGPEKPTYAEAVASWNARRKPSRGH
ncbi:hypothetical protein NKI48_03080 [Mesorhizobium sp. M0644]|uniref:hypothetical protein n=1 Tax=Mesorhizobium sp. M0644 TaxID=2956979 RepID=UPI00333DD973